MAKRKRLGPVDPENLAPASGIALLDGGARRAAPIADVAGEAAAHAALEEVSAELTEARREGRLIRKLPLSAVETQHLIRDRIGFDPEEMEALKASLAARGQQVPIEVIDQGRGSFGLISGWRRVEALRQLGVEEVLALVRAPQNSAEAYLAMIEENEIRAGLSYYERARLAYEAVGIGVFVTAKQAVSQLFAAASPAKRSKILKFVVLHDRLGEHLNFPAAIPERLGLALSAALETDKALAARLRDTLRKNPAETAEAERRQLESALRKQSAPASPPAPAGDEVAPGLYLAAGKNRLVLSGKGLDAALLADLKVWLAERAG